MVTLKMIAEETGLSIAAVSKALNHLPGVSEENAKRVREVARRMDYYPNGAAQTLKTNHSYNIGIVYQNRMAHEHFAKVLEAIRDTVEDAGYDLTFLGSKGVRERGYYAHAMRRNCDGILVAQNNLDPEDLKRAAKGKLPVVAIDQKFEGRTAVVNADEESAEEIVRYLYGKGHRRIAFIYGELGEVSRLRLRGFRLACQDLGLEIPEDYLVQGHFGKPDDAGRLTEQFMRLPEPPTCILYPDDVATLGGFGAAERMGLSIPDDFSIFGYDGIQLTQLLRPHVTTYAQDAEGIGRAAAQELIAAIDAGSSYVAKTVVVSGRILEGETVRTLSA